MMLPAISPAIVGLLPDPVASVLLALAIILIGARLGGAAAEQLGRPAVFGELLVGVVLGNLQGARLDWLVTMRTNAPVDLLAQVGAVILLFQVERTARHPAMNPFRRARVHSTWP